MASTESMRGLRRGVGIIQVLVNNGGAMTFSEIQASCGGLAAPTLSRILKVLIDEGMLNRNEGQGPYELGGRFRGMARRFCGVASVEELVKPGLRNLAMETEQTSCLFVWDEDGSRLVAKHEMNESMHIIDVGERNTRVFRNGFGQACITQLDEQQIISLLETLEEKPVLPVADYLARLKSARDEGILVENGEANPRIHRVVAPLRIGKDQRIAAVGICSGKAVDGRIDFIEAVQDAAKRICSTCKDSQV